MKRFLSGLGAAAAMLALPVAAHAYTATAVSDLNLRACPSTQCPALAVIPRGMPVNVIGAAGGWDYVTYGGITGYAAANYLYAGYAGPRPPVVAAYPFPAPAYGYVVAPWWDPTYGAWYDGRRWFYDGRWYSTPGFSLSFSFGF